MNKLALSWRYKYFNIQKSICVIKYRNGFNVKKHLIIRINGEKASDKIQHTFIIYVLEKVILERIYLSGIISMYEKPMTNIILNR